MPQPRDLSKRARGAFGERLAATTYRRRGAEILDRNWRTSTGELDLVVREGDVYVFCEVKTRRSRRYGSPLEAITPQKAARIRRVADEWLRSNGLHGVTTRFDVVSIVGVELDLVPMAF
mgnify:FL=1